jgi:hypothetical protein
MVVGWLSRAVAQQDQDDADEDAHEANADTHALQRAKPAPLAGADKVHADDGGDAEKSDPDHNDAQLTFGDHRPAL